MVLLGWDWGEEEEFMHLVTFSVWLVEMVDMFSLGCVC